MKKGLQSRTNIWFRRHNYGCRSTVDVGEGIRTGTFDLGTIQFSVFFNDIGRQPSKLYSYIQSRNGDRPNCPCLNYYQYHLKGISLLPRHDYETYPQMANEYD